MKLVNLLGNHLNINLITLTLATIYPSSFPSNSTDLTTLKVNGAIVKDVVFGRNGIFDLSKETALVVCLTKKKKQFSTNPSSREG